MNLLRFRSDINIGDCNDIRSKKQELIARLEIRAALSGGGHMLYSASSLYIRCSRFLPASGHAGGQGLVYRFPSTALPDAELPDPFGGDPCGVSAPEQLSFSF